jgi:hypothetical protein
MRYYYLLLRCHVSNYSHIRNRKNLDKSWKFLLENRRKLRVLQTKILNEKKKNKNN